MAMNSRSRSGNFFGLPDKDPARQFEWHESYRDLSKNMYRTTYTDATHFRETYVKSDYPAGYGGHIQSMRHDCLFRNTEFDRKRELMRQDPSRDSHPSFIDQLAGLPTLCKNPCGATANPKHKVSYHDGTTAPLAPWGITSRPARDPLNHRFMPPTMKRAMSQPSILQGGKMSATDRLSNAARSMGVRQETGEYCGGGEYAGPDAACEQDQPCEMYQQHPQVGTPQHSQLATPQHSQVGTPLHRAYGPPNGNTPPGSSRLKRTVDHANSEAMRGRFPTEGEILREQMTG